MCNNESQPCMNMHFLQQMITNISNSSDPDEIKNTQSLWISCSDGDVPPTAIPGGFDKELLFIGRAVHKNALTPGKIIRSEGVCSLPWGGFEHKKTDYQVFCGCDVVWIPNSNGNIPRGSLPSGKTEYGELLYTGRANHNGVNIIGKIARSHKVCYIAYDGREIPYSVYEVLVLKSLQLKL